MTMIRYATFVIALMCVSISHADVYKRIDTGERAYYTDQLKDGFKYKLIIPMRSKSYSHTVKSMEKNKLKYSALITAAAEKYKLDAKLLHAIIQIESAYNEKATSPAGAVGLMQLMPATAKRYGVQNRKNAKQNIDGGSHYLKDLFNMFDANLKLVLAGYNAGESTVKKYSYTIPPYPETQNYIRKVMKLYQD